MMKGEAGYHRNMQKACYSSKVIILCLVKSNYKLKISNVSVYLF